MLLLYDDPSGWQEMSPEDMQKAIQKYFAWREKLRSQRIFVGSAKLAADAGKVIRGKDRIHVTDGPYSETKEVLGGYFTIEAPNYDTAVAHLDLAEECVQEALLRALQNWLFSGIP